MCLALLFELNEPDSDLAGSSTPNQLKRKRKGVESLPPELYMDEASQIRSKP